MAVTYYYYFFVSVLPLVKHIGHEYKHIVLPLAITCHEYKHIDYI